MFFSLKQTKQNQLLQWPTLQQKPEPTCKQNLQLLTLVGNNVVGGWDKSAAGTVDAQLQTQVVFCSAEDQREKLWRWGSQTIEKVFQCVLRLTWIRHPVLNGLSDFHRNPGSLGFGLEGARVDVTLSGSALLIRLQQLNADKCTGTRSWLKQDTKSVRIISYWCSFTDHWVPISLFWQNKWTEQKHFQQAHQFCFLHFLGLTFFSERF